MIANYVWNMMYEALLRLSSLSGATTAGFTEEIAIVVVGKFIKAVTWIANEAIRTIRQ